MDKHRAERDQIYFAAGLRPTRDYYIDILGFEEKHFEIVLPEETQAAQLSDRVLLSHDDMVMNAKDHALIAPLIEKVIALIHEAKDEQELQKKIDALNLNQEETRIINQLMIDSVSVWSQNA